MSSGFHGQSSPPKIWRVELIDLTSQEKPPFWKLLMRFSDGSMLTLEFNGIPGIAFGKSPEYISFVGLQNGGKDFSCIVTAESGRRDRFRFDIPGQEKLSNGGVAEKLQSVAIRINILRQHMQQLAEKGEKLGKDLSSAFRYADSWITWLKIEAQCRE